MKFSFFLFVLLSSTYIFAQNFGKISGKIIDGDTKTELVGANVFVLNTKIGIATGLDGSYQIENIPEGEYSIKISFVGYKSIMLKGITIIADSTTIVNAELFSHPMQMEEVSILAKKYFETKSTNTCKVVTNGERLRNVYMTRYNTEEYNRIEENTFFDALKTPLSTFGADVDVASYANARRFIMKDQLPYKDAIRTEEFINYFNYDYKQPKNNHPLSINLEFSDCPWNEKNKLIHIGLKGKEISNEEQKPSNLVFLIDVSGSMNDPKKLPLLKKSFHLLVDELKENDKIAIVVYATSTGLVLPSTFGSEKDKIIDVLDNLRASGSTAGGSGIQLAYKVATENFIEGGNNRIILATDGDFNVGASTSELVRLVEKEREKGIFLTILGFGMGNYKDARLQQLANKGNGNHGYIDNILEAKKILVNDITSTLFTIAKDVKIQVEFNPAKIESYRLIGYENRRLDAKDFKDDKKDAGEIGAGHSVTALYEVRLVDSENINYENELKYQDINIKDSAKSSNEVLTVKIRYKEPDGEVSTEFSDVLKGNPIALKESSDNFRFSASVAEFAMILRDSKLKRDSDIESVLELSKSSRGDDVFGYRAEFINLVERVKILLDE